MADLDRILSAVDRGLDRSVERLFELARIPSISTDPQHRQECRKAAQWLTDDMGNLGFSSSLRDTEGHPLVIGHYPAAGHRPRAPRFLFYGHYDVQPADPLGKWLSPPFEPHRRKENGVERLYGRGMADDKGQLMTFIEAFRYWLEAEGSLPFNVTVLLEGEEESGSPSLVPFLRANTDELRCDAAFICDTGLWDERTPAITTRLRGLMHEELTITGPLIDLHSGLYGGAAQNPIRVLSKVIASFHDRNGRVTIPGFYDGVEEPPPAIKRQWRALKFSDSGFLRSVGLSVPAGEKGRTVLEQVWSRPTLEINGIYGGYMGKGTKTVLPSEATAKISCRLVGTQNPRKIRAALRRHVKSLLPKDCRASFGGKSGNPAVVVPENNPYLRKAAAGLKAEFGRDAVLIGSGGSIPVVGHFKDVLKMDSVLLGFSLDDDAIHSPNEKYNLSSFHRGIRSWVRIIAELAA
ncbi:MAG TPA: dipeptidase [Aestuariivirgaceae bacterium]|jgi:acetylornithine deacetylase/succinyl-diaminopimelate desuccinylase-like protein